MLHTHCDRYGFLNDLLVNPDVHDRHIRAAARDIGVVPTSVLDSMHQISSLQFYLGPPGSGAPLHWHTNAINSQAFGRKRWSVVGWSSRSFWI